MAWPESSGIELRHRFFSIFREREFQREVLLFTFFSALGNIVRNPKYP